MALIFVAILASSIGMSIAYTDTSYNTESSGYKMLVECVENYDDNPLKYVCDAASSFINIIRSHGDYDYWYFSNSAAWPSDWWTKEARYDHYYPVYHAYLQHYAIFLGHAQPGRFQFSYSSTASNGYSYSEVWLVLQGPNGATWMYPNDNDNDGIYTRWITVFGCRLLDDNGYSSMGMSIYDVFYYTFTNQGESPVYLHGIVGARTKMLDWYKACTYCSEVPVFIYTMNAYADNLVSGKSITDSWFEAVWKYNNQKDAFGNIVFQAHPAALYYVVEFRDSTGHTIAIFNYKNEGMLNFSSTVYSAPSQLNPPPGTAQIIYWEVYLVG